MPEKKRLHAYLLSVTKDRLQDTAEKQGRSVGSVIDDLVALYQTQYLRERGINK